jgi:hypothetical protein
MGESHLIEPLGLEPRTEILSRAKVFSQSHRATKQMRAISELLLDAMLAEREGFEPPIPLRVCLISSQVHSTGLCHLSGAGSLY